MAGTPRYLQRSEFRRGACDRSSAAVSVRSGQRDIPVTSNRMQSMASPKPVALETRWRANAVDLKAFIKRLTASLEADEDGQGMRQRKRKAADQKKFARAVEAIGCNFVAAALAFPDDHALAVQRANYASGNSPIYGAHFKRVTDLMEKRGLITTARGRRFSKFERAASTIRPTARYWETAPKLSEGWRALHLEELRELVRVNADNDKQRTPAPSDWLARAEAEVAAINEHLKSIKLGFGGLEVFSADMDNKLAIILATPQHRTVHRAFKGSIQRGGRLYSGAWETMPREDRFKLLTINGEPVVNVDYGQLFLRLAYALEGVAPPPGDLYDLMSGNDPPANHEQAPMRRDAIKRMVNAMFSAKRALKQWPGETNAERARIRDAFRPSTKPSDVVRAIKEKHRAIADNWFEQGRGLELHRLESDILIAAMLRLISMGVSSLPLHDSVIVARSDGETARRVMQEEAFRVTGAEIPVKIDAG